MIKEINKNIILPSGVRLLVDIAIPIRETFNPEAVNDDFIDDIMCKQIQREANGVTSKYATSALPFLFLRGQNLIVTNNMPTDTLGYFDQRNDDIYLDADGLSISLKYPNTFIFGHEMGHKIQKYRKVDEAYSFLADFFGIDNHDKELLGEVHADVIGNILCNGYYDEDYLKTLEEIGAMPEDDIYPHIDTTLTYEQGAYIKKRVLHNIYHI